MTLADEQLTIYLRNENYAIHHPVLRLVYLKLLQKQGQYLSMVALREYDYRYPKNAWIENQSDRTLEIALTKLRLLGLAKEYQHTWQYYEPTDVKLKCGQFTPLEELHQQFELLEEQIEDKQKQEKVKKPRFKILSKLFS